MQYTNDIPQQQKRPSALSQAKKIAAKALRKDEQLISLLVAYLLCSVMLFALSFVIVALAFVTVPLTAGGVILFSILRYGIGVAVFVAFILPLFTGRARMIAMSVAGVDVTPKDFFHYFASWRLWWRGVRIALLWPIAFLVPPFFSAPTLALGNEDMPLGKALALSRGRIRVGVVLALWWRLIWRFLLGILTLGVLWLLYDAHHVPATYFALVMQQEAERT